MKQKIRLRHLVCRSAIRAIGHLVIGVGFASALLVITGLFLENLHSSTRNLVFILPALVGGSGFFLVGLRLVKHTSKKIIDLADFDDNVVVLRQYGSHRPDRVHLESIRNVSIIAKKPGRDGNASGSVWNVGLLGVFAQYIARLSENGYEPTLLIKTEKYRHYHCPATGTYQHKIIPLVNKILEKSPQATWHISVPRHMREAGLENPIPQDKIIEERDYKLPTHKINIWQIFILVLAAILLLFLQN